MSVESIGFLRPPLIETATSVQFNQLGGFGSAMLALFWNEHLRKEYPKPSDAAPIEPQVERFGGGFSPKAFPVFRIRSFPGARLMLASEDGHWMVQVQNGRLVFNWRKLEGGEYPRWHHTLPRFEDAYKKLKRFMDEHGLGVIQPHQWEVTYANHFVKGEDWNRPEDWPDLVPGILGRPKAVSGLRLDSASGKLRLEIEPQRGRLHVELDHGVRRTGETEEQVLVLQLTARGSVDGVDDESLRTGLNLGRTAIVKTFVEITGETAQKRWGRQDVIG